MATFPASLPRPLAPGYGLTPQPQGIRTEMETGSPRVRRRSAVQIDAVNVSWLFTSSQMLIFRAWFDSPSYAAGGSAWFDLDIYSGDGGIRSRECRFLEQWDGQLVSPDTWRVSAKLETRGGDLTADQVRGAIEGLMVGNVYPTLVLEFATDLALDSRITFTRATTATYYDATGTMQTAAANAARFDHDPVTLASLGLLIEEARTNLVLNSAALVTQNVTVAATAHTLSFMGTGTVTLSGVSTSGPLVGTGATNRVSLTFTPTAGVLVLTVTGSVTLAQLEAGSFATSYIPTTSVAVTRNADVATMTGTNFSGWYSATGGALLVGAKLAAASGSERRLCSIMVDASNRNADIFLTLAGDPELYVRNAAVEQAAVVAGSAVSYGSAFTVAAGFADNNFNISRNGSIGTDDTSGLLPSGTAAFYIGTFGGTSAWINGHIKRIVYYPSRLSNAQLQALTA